MSKIFLFQVFKPKYKSLIAQTIHVLSLNCRKHGMCEMVSKCSRKLDHYGRRSNDKKKLHYRCLPCTIYILFKCLLKIMKKTWPTSHLSLKRTKRFPRTLKTTPPRYSLDTKVAQIYHDMQMIKVIRSPSDQRWSNLKVIYIIECLSE